MENAESYLSVVCVTVSKCNTPIERIDIIKELAANIDCSSPERLCKTVHSMTLNKNSLPFIPFAIQSALQEQNGNMLQFCGKKTSLHWACMYGYADCTRALIEATKNTNNDTLQKLILSQSTSGQTALHWACRNGSVACAKEILKAAKECESEILQKLLAIRDLGYPDKYQSGGQTAYHKTYINCKDDCVELLKLVYKEVNLELPNPWDR